VTYTLAQPGKGKADALNFGLRKARGQFVVFVDADVILKGGENSTVRDMLEHGAEFVSASYGRRPAPFPVDRSRVGMVLRREPGIVPEPWRLA